MAHSLYLDNQEIPLKEGENVLEALERQGVSILSSCRSGVCQSCLVKAVDGKVPARAQQGLKESHKAQGYFLSCVCVPEENMRVALPAEDLDFNSEIIESDDIGAGVRRIRLAIPDGFTWFAGQYLTIIREDGIARSYSVASSPEDGYLELHVRRVPGGMLSNWFHDEVQPGTPLRFRGPLGDCFYTADDPHAPLLLAGTGTGLAPLYGVLKDALRKGHEGAIRLFHGALDKKGLYQRDELKALASENKLEYSACVLRDDPGEETHLLSGALDEVVLSQPLDVKVTKAYLCGDPVLVEKMRKKLFLKGLSNRRIFADAFISAVVKQD